MMIGLMTAAHRGGVERILDGLRAWRERRRLRRELGDAPGSERARLLHDLNVTPAQLDQVIAGPGTAQELLPEMMARYGLDAGAVAREHEAVMLDLQRTCSNCPVKRTCRRALKRGADHAECSRFCINDTTLDSLVREQAVRA